MENDSLILQEIALDVQSTVATYDKSWNRDINNIRVDRHNKCVNCMANILQKSDMTLYVGVLYVSALCL